MIQIILIALTLIHYEQNKYVPPVSEYVSPHEDMREPIKATWYVNPNKKRTANGSRTFIGSCAASRDHLGDVAALYSIEGYFIGYLDCNDTGGAEGIKNGTVIDIYAEDLDQIKRTAEEWGTEFQIVWIKAEG